jgi:O-antigen ligase
MDTRIKFLGWLLIFTPFTLLVVTNTTLFPFITGKALLFRSLISIAIIPFLYLISVYKGIFSKRDLILWGLLAYFLTGLAGTIFSIDPLRSFGGNAERMEGLWSLFFYLLYPLFLITLFKIEPEYKKKIFYAFLIVNIIISLTIVFQKIQNPYDRPYASLGNATYIGFYSLLMFFIILYFLFQEKNKILQSIYIIALILNILSILFSETRGSIIGLAFGFISFFFYIILKQKTKTRFLLLASMILFLVLSYAFLKTSLALKIPGIKRVAYSIQEPSSYMARVVSWQIFLEAFKEKPIFGYGLENMPYAFYRHFKPILFHYEEAIFDRPHNKFIEMLASTGIVGFIFWLIFLITAFLFILKSKENFLSKASLVALFISYLAQNFTLFDMQASYLTFFFGLSLATEKALITKRKNINLRPVMAIAFAFSFVFLLIHYKHYQIVRNIIKAIRSSPREAALIFENTSKEAGPFLTELGSMAHRYLIDLLIQKQADLKSEDLVKIFYVFENAALNDPYNLRLYLAYINFQKDIAIRKKEQGIDYKKDLENLRKMLQKSKERFPRYPDLLMTIFQTEASFGEKQKAIEELYKIYEEFAYGPNMNTAIGNNAFYLGEYHIALKAYERALNYYKKPPSDQFFINFVISLLETKRFKELQEFLDQNQEYLKKPQILQNVKNLIKEYSAPIKLNLTN